MKRPTVFVSSTIYDFSDLRSALKFWLSEMGFNAQLSEYNDFKKNLNTNSYEACLQSVEASDYFILLIGTRRGGMYPNEDISITRKEYRVAYELAKAGKIKKLIVFIRQNVWNVKEDRKALHKLLQDITILENDKLIDIDRIENYNSNILKDAKHITSFIDEVTRKEDARNGNMPNMNWVHTFNSFEDIISTLKVELKVNEELSVQVAEQNIKMALVYTLQKIVSKGETGELIEYYLPFEDIRNKLKKFRADNENFSINTTIRLTQQEVHNMSYFLLFCCNGIDELMTYEFENALSNGVFIDFDLEKGSPVYNNFCIMLHQLIEEINKVKRFSTDFKLETQQKMVNIIHNYPKGEKGHYEFNILDLTQLNSIYERIINIREICIYLVKCINTHNKDLELPLILNGFVDTERPSEFDILKIFNNIS